MRRWSFSGSAAGCSWRRSQLSESSPTPGRSGCSTSGASNGTSTVNSPRSRKGSAEDRGKVLNFPASEAAAPPPKHGFWGGVRRLGPGLVTGAADVDPSAVLTATVVGAAYHYGLLWVVILCVPFLVEIFRVAGRIGHETRQGLVELLRIHYGRKLALTCAGVIVAINMAMIVADLLAVSDGLSIVLRQPRWFFVVGVAFSVWYLLIFREYHRITRVLLLLSLPLYLYVAAAVIASPSQIGRSHV